MVNCLRRIIAFLMLFVLVLAYPMPGIADIADQKPESKRLKIGYIHYEGFIGTEDGEYYNGYGVAILNRISRYTGWKYEYYYNTWEACLDDLEQGKIDLVCCAQYKPDRAERFDYTSCPIGQESTYIYTRKGSKNIYYQDYAAMDGSTAAILKGSYQRTEFAVFAQEKGFTYKELVFDSIDEIVEAVKNGSADLAVVGSLSRQPELRIVDKLGASPFYIITTKGNTEVRDSINEALENIFATSPYLVEELYHEYYGKMVLTQEPLFTREEAEYISRSNPLTVACIDGFYPLSYSEPETGEAAGIFPDLIRRLADISGLEFKLSVEPSGSRPERLIESGKADIVAGILFSQEKIQKPNVQLTDNITSQPALVVVNSGVNVYDLNNAVMALPYSYEDSKSLLPREFSGFQIIFKENLEDCFRAVINYEADLTVQNTHVVNYFMQKREFSSLGLAAMQSLEEKSSLMLSAAADRELVSILNKSINCINDNTINQLTMAHTVGRPYRMTFLDMIYFYRWQLLFLTILLTLLIVLLALLYHRHMNITMERKEKETYRLMAETDELTGMLNRKTFYEKAVECMEGLPAKKYQILFFNVENFKIINDLFGAAAGDRLLLFLAEIIKEWTNHHGGVCARFEADHFAVCVRDNTEYAEEITDRIQEALKAYPVDMTIEVSCGVYQVHDMDKSINIMCDRAHLAVNSIKGNYARRVAVYDDFHRKTLIHSQLIVSEMSTAMKEKQFQVYLQPKYNMDTEKIIGAEALVRWVHPERGIIPPGDFIPIFEHNGFIGQLDTYMFEETCRLLQGWIDAGKEVVSISVNLSRVGFYNPKLCENLYNIAEKYQIPLNLLELEITETAYAADSRAIHDQIQQLRNKGFRILMDDFGSGYSSLNMLKEAPVDQIKLDMRFLSASDPYGRAEIILKMVIAMGDALAIPILAEGVETKNQVEMLKNYSCCLAQGYYYSRPLPVQKFEELLDKKAGI